MLDRPGFGGFTAPDSRRARRVDDAARLTRRPEASSSRALVSPHLGTRGRGSRVFRNGDAPQRVRRVERDGFQHVRVRRLARLDVIVVLGGHRSPRALRRARSASLRARASATRASARTCAAASWAGTVGLCSSSRTSAARRGSGRHGSTYVRRSWGRARHARGAPPSRANRHLRSMRRASEGSSSSGNSREDVSRVTTAPVWRSDRNASSSEETALWRPFVSDSSPLFLPFIAEYRAAYARSTRDPARVSVVSEIRFARAAAQVRVRVPRLMTSGRHGTRPRSRGSGRFGPRPPRLFALKQTPARAHQRAEDASAPRRRRRRPFFARDRMEASETFSLRPPSIPPSIQPAAQHAGHQRAHGSKEEPPDSRRRRRREGDAVVFLFLSRVVVSPRESASAATSALVACSLSAGSGLKADA